MGWCWLIGQGCPPHILLRVRLPDRPRPRRGAGDHRHQGRHPRHGDQENAQTGTSAHAQVCAPHIPAPSLCLQQSGWWRGGRTCRPSEELTDPSRRTPKSGPSASSPSARSTSQSHSNTCPSNRGDQYLSIGQSLLSLGSGYKIPWGKLARLPTGGLIVTAGHGMGARGFLTHGRGL